MADKKASATSLKSSDYVHLHNHTQYSLLDGLTKVPDLIKHVQDTGMEAVAVTDHGTLSGSIEFYKAAKEAGVKPIIGMEAYVAARTLYDKEPGKDKQNYHVILLAMDQAGYQNLMALSTIANLEGFYYKPRIDRQLLESHNEGLICLSGCASSEIGEALRSGQYAQAKDIASWYKQAFGDRYYLEIQDHGHPKHTSMWEEQQTINDGLFKISKELDIPCVVTCDAHYLKHEDQEAHEILLCVQTGSFLSDDKRMSLKDFELHVTDPKEIISRWGKSHPELITNTRKIADRCDIQIELGKILIPKFPVPTGDTEKSYLRKLVFRGLAWRYGGVPEQKAIKLSVDQALKSLSKDVVERAEYELSVIGDMNFNGYFLIIADFVNWGKDQGIVFGPGRGSAAGSIIAYSLKITELDPLKYDLMFERFLNPDRISMPDIDIDIQDNRREEVIQYCVEKYGKDRVANIVTFGRMAARNAVRDVARVLQVPYAEADRLAKMIPPPVQGRHIPLAKSLKENSDLKHEYNSSNSSKEVFDLAMQLEGTIRSHGVHAAGVVIAPEDIVCFTPLELAQKGVVATQYSMGPIEELGLLKMDFLGLSNLTILNNTLRIVRKVYGTELDLNDIPIEDKETFDLLQKADTTGVFQLESAGMKRYLKELKPTLFEDIIAIGALYRPGPMSEIPRFIKGKNNPASITYLHGSLKPILQDTYGVMVYQEQIIKLLQLVAGYTPGEADLVRKAIGKKKRDIMEAEEPKFIEGCIKQGLSRSDAQKLWAQIQPFADYSFNKAHATCYAQISYWTAYLKAHYPAAFMAALMTSDYDDKDRLAIEITECKHMGIKVLPPDVNESFLEFAVVPGEQTVRFGMGAIKNVGSGPVEEILRARAAGAFTSLEDFLTRVSNRLVNRKTLESLIKSGAFDRFGERSELLYNLDLIIAFASRLQKQADSGQTDIFGNSSEVVMEQPKLELQPVIDPTDDREQLVWERELLGLYLSQHPLELFETILAEKSIPIKSITTDHDGKKASLGGTIIDSRVITTKNGQKMAFVKIEDLTGEIEAIVFPSKFQDSVDLWQLDKVVIVTGKLNSRGRDGQSDGDIKIMVDEVKEITTDEAKNYKPTGVNAKPLKAPKAVKNSKVNSTEEVNEDNVDQQKIERLYIRLKSTSDEKTLLSLKNTIDNNRGDTEVVLVLGQDASKQAIKLPGGINSSGTGVNELKELVGADNLVIR